MKNSFRFVKDHSAFFAMKSSYQRTSRLLLILWLIFSAGVLQAQETEFSPLFDGKSLNGWVGNKSSYLVKDGMIVIEPKGGGGGNLCNSRLTNVQTDHSYRLEAPFISKIS